MANAQTVPGTVYWITGLSGAGKTTIGKLFYAKLKQAKPNVVFLDGDLIREALGNDLGHSREDRNRSARRNSGLCKLLCDQGIDVVIATISLFHAVHDWNRANIANYIEIVLDVPIECLASRDAKGIYASQERENIVGLGIKEEYPLAPDITLINDGSIPVDQVVCELITQVDRLNTVRKHGGDTLGCRA